MTSLSPATEVTVLVKGENDTYKQRFLCYESFSMNFDDPTLKDYVRIALKQCGKSTDDDIDVIVRISAIWS